MPLAEDRFNPDTGMYEFEVSMSDEEQDAPDTVVDEVLLSVEGDIVELEMGEEVELAPFQGWITIGTFITNVDNPIWDLSSFQNLVYPGATRWRVKERLVGITYFSGEADENYKLLNVPSTFETGYYYDGFMEFQVFIGPYDGS